MWGLRNQQFLNKKNDINPENIEKIEIMGAVYDLLVAKNWMHFGQTGCAD